MLLNQLFTLKFYQDFTKFLTSKIENYFIFQLCNKPSNIRIKIKNYKIDEN